ncbi:MAG: hypothetical protein FJ296_07295 [Planctomycetes bacterium]|nr:hypothetical protein [Planctomycetota bacterium]
MLYLHGVRVVNGESLIGNDDLSVPTMFFDDPVPVGDTTTELDVNFDVTPITAKIEVSIDLGVDEISGVVFVAGTITSRWNSVPAPIDTPLGTLGDDETLAELEITANFTYSSPDQDINNELIGVQTNKGVSGIMGPDIGFVLIDGQGQQQKIVNRAILPGQLVSNPEQPDAFPDVPPGDLESFSLSIPEVVTLHDGVGVVADGDVTDGNLTLEGIELEHALGGALLLTAQVSSESDLPVELIMVGKAKVIPATGALKVTLAGATKKLNNFEFETFAKLIKFKVVQEILPPYDPTDLVITWTGGKDPVTKLPITGTLLLQVQPYVGNSVDVAVNLPVDVPKLVKGLLSINPAKRSMGSEGTLVLGNVTAADVVSKTFPIVLRETATVKDGLPTARTYKLSAGREDAQDLRPGRHEHQRPGLRADQVQRQDPGRQDRARAARWGERHGAVAPGA